MKHRIAGLFIALMAIALLPCHAFSQGDINQPPTCCKNNDAPPPPGSDTVAAGMATDAIPQVALSDATLSAMGITRSQFLDRLAATLFPDPAQTISLVIPVITLSFADGGIPTQVTYYQFDKSQVPAEFIDATDLLYITDGQIYVEVIFIPDAAMNP